MALSKEVQECHLKNVFSFDGYRVELESRRLVSPEGQELYLRPKAFEMLVYLLRSADRVISKEELLDTLWPETEVEESSVPHCISEIREVLGDQPEQPRCIRTVPRMGYQFIAAVTQVFPVHGQPASEAARVRVGSGDSVGKTVEVSVEPFVKRWRQMVPWGLTVLLSVITAVSLFLLWRGMQQEPQLVRFTATLPQGQWLESLATGSSVAIAPDGKTIAYVGSEDGSQQLYLRPINALETVVIAGTEGAEGPFFSLNGRWLGFFAEERLKKVAISGGLPQVICEAPRYTGGTWDEDNTILFGDRSGGVLWRVSANGGEPSHVPISQQEPDRTGPALLWPQFLPGNNAVLLTVGPAGTWSVAGSKIGVLLLETGILKILTEKGIYARYAPTGHLVYVWDGNLLAAPFDVKNLEVTGPAVPVEGQIRFRENSVAHFAFSQNGALAYVPPWPVGSGEQLVWADFVGNVEELPVPPGSYWSPRISPDGTQIMYASMRDIWIYDLDRETHHRLTHEGGDEYHALWEPGGRSVIFQSTREGSQLNLYRQLADRSEPAERLTKSGDLQQPYSCSSDGKILMFQQNLSTGDGFDIWRLSLDGEKKPQPFLQTRFNEYHPSISPDGRWLAYVSEQSGQAEVQLRPFPGPGGAVPISRDGGQEPLWAPDGRELYYRDKRGSVLAVSLQTAPKLHVGKTRLVLEGEYERGTIYGRRYDIAPDGRRFLMIKRGDSAPAQQQFVVVLNWFEELERLAPMDN